jgi:hypothetical protein
MEERNNDQRLMNTKVLHKRLDAAGWGLFFVWIGIALAAHVGWGAGLLGVGIITLGGQVMRKYFALRVEIFWVMAGFFFLVGGVWELVNVQFGLIPILCIAVGLILLVSTFVGKAGHCILK